MIDFQAVFQKLIGCSRSIVLSLIDKPVRLAFGCVLLIGLVLRMRYALLVTPHVDEFATVYAADTILHRGVPLLPSGYFYTHGLLVSYLLAPFVLLSKLEFLPTELLWRLPSVLFSLATCLLVYRQGRSLFGDGVGFLAAFLLAVHPESIRWGSRARMYAFLQFATGLTVFSLFEMMRERGDDRWLFPLFFTAAALTHLEIFLLFPALVAGVIVVGNHHRLLCWQSFLKFGLCVTTMVLSLRLETLGSSQLTGSSQSLFSVRDLSQYIGVFDVARLRFYTRYFTKPSQLYLSLAFATVLFLLFFYGVYRAFAQGSVESFEQFSPTYLAFFSTIYLVTLLEFLLLVRWPMSEHYLFFILPMLIMPASWILWYGATYILRLLGDNTPILACVDSRCLGNRRVCRGLGPFLAIAGSVLIMLAMGGWVIQADDAKQPDYTGAFRHVQQRWRTDDIILSPSVGSCLYLGRLDYFPLEKGYDFAVVTNDSGNQVHVLTGAPWLGATEELAKVLHGESRKWFVVDDQRFVSRYTQGSRKLVNQNMALARAMAGIRVYISPYTSQHETGEDIDAETAALDYIHTARPDIVEFYTDRGWPANDLRAMVRDWLRMTDEPLVKEAGRDAVSVAIALGWHGQEHASDRS